MGEMASDSGSPLSSECDGSELEDDAVTAADTGDPPMSRTPAAESGLGAQPDFLPSLEIQPSSFDAWLKLQRDQPVKALEVRSIKPPTASWMDTNRLFRPPFIGLVPAVVTPAQTRPAMPEPGVATQLAMRRLRFTSMLKIDDRDALKKLKYMILESPDASKLGRNLVSAVGFLQSVHEWECSFNDAFEGKATATLTKRASALWRFSEWCSDNNLGPVVTSDEGRVYRYMQHLKEHGAPTAAAGFIQAWTFLHYQAGLLTCALEDILSSRVRGAARAVLSEKRVLRQAAPLSVKMIVALENVANLAPYQHWRIIAGHFLLCLRSCSRFSDSIHLHKLEVSEANGLELVEAESKSFKTAGAEERKKHLLPLLSLGRFFGRQPWASDWLQQRQEARLPLDPSLPAFSEITGEWMDRRMSTGEAFLYLREFLLSSGFKQEDLVGVGCRSLKVTLLSWASKGDYLTINDRLVMGHRMTRENQSAVVYARDELTRVMVTVHQIFFDIRHRTFKPDASRAERLAALVPDVPEEFQRDAGFESEDDINEADIDRAPIQRESNINWDDVAVGVLARVRIHVHSGVVHVLSEADRRRFKCGRKFTANFQDLPANVNYSDIPACKQCRI